LDGNGIGDLAGIKVRLEKLRKLGIGALFLRPIIKVEKSGMGVIGHTKLSSQIGSMEDFDEFVKAAHDKGRIIFSFYLLIISLKDIRILIDFPLVVTSIAHPWFDRSALASRPENSNFANFYYWRRGISNSEYISAYKNSMLKYFHVKSRPDLPILAWQNAGNVSDAIKVLFLIQLEITKNLGRPFILDWQRCGWFPFLLN
jgi:glycosidase